MLGYGVEFVENGEKGFNIWWVGYYLIILIDLYMLKMLGYDMVEKICNEVF